MRIVLYTFIFYCHITLLLGQTFKDSVLVFHSEDIYFDNNSHAVDLRYTDKIQNFIKKAITIKGTNIYLEGHTNSIGSEAYNQALSDRRVNAVRDLLIQSKINANSISKEALGKSKPQYPNEDRGLELNRQVKMQLTKVVKMRLIKGKLTPSSAMKKGVPITFQNKLFNTTVYTDEKGGFEVYVPDRLAIAVSAKQKGFINDYLEIMPNEKTNPLDVKMMEIIAGKSVYITSLNFFGDKNILIESSKASLSHLTEQIVENTFFCFEIQGHVNAPHLKPENISQYLHDLSIARAGFVYEHLKNNGVMVERMIANGYGDNNMLFPRPQNDEQHLFNRRVELKIYTCPEIAKLRETFDENYFIDMANKKAFR